MKFNISQLTIAVTALLSAVATVPEAKSADLALEGYGSYNLGNFDRYYPRGTRQSGRYRNLGADYYRSAEIEVDAVENYSNYRSGSMSFELWAMPYYGATSGSILMTNSLRYLKAGRYYSGVYCRGMAVSLDEEAFPELNLWEYTNHGWMFRDALTFPDEEWL
jgi:hypothetical protein